MYFECERFKRMHDAENRWHRQRMKKILADQWHGRLNAFHSLRKKSLVASLFSLIAAATATVSSFRKNRLGGGGGYSLWEIKLVYLINQSIDKHTASLLVTNYYPLSWQHWEKWRRWRQRRLILVQRSTPLTLGTVEHQVNLKACPFYNQPIWTIRWVSVRMASRWLPVGLLLRWRRSASQGNEYKQCWSSSKKWSFKCDLKTMLRRATPTELNSQIKSSSSLSRWTHRLGCKQTSQQAVVDLCLPL